MNILEREIIKTKQIKSEKMFCDLFCVSIKYLNVCKDDKPIELNFTMSMLRPPLFLKRMTKEETIPFVLKHGDSVVHSKINTGEYSFRKGQ